MKTEVEHHYGWVDTKGKTPYEHTRETHHFLNDDNHEFEDTGHSIVIKRNENSPEYSKFTPDWAKGKFWFSMRYRIN